MIKLIIVVSLAIEIQARIHIDKLISLEEHAENSSNLGWLFGLEPRSIENNTEATAVCETKECVMIANVLNKSMDTSVDPCEDFYEYACGRWSEENPLPEGMIVWNIWTMAAVKVQVRLYKIITEGLQNDDILAMKLTRKWYKTCVNARAAERRGLEPLFSMLKRSGGWPMTMRENQWNETEWNWQKVDDFYAQLTGRNAFHNVAIYRDLNETAVLLRVPHLPPGTNELYQESDDNENNDESEDEVDNSEEEDISDEDSDENEASKMESAEDDDRVIRDEKPNHKKRDDERKENHVDSMDVTRKKSKTRALNEKSRSRYGKSKEKEKETPEEEEEKKKHRTRSKRHVMGKNIDPTGRKYDEYKTSKHTMSRHKSNKETRNRIMREKKMENSHGQKSVDSTAEMNQDDEEKDEEESTPVARYASYIAKVARALAAEENITLSPDELRRDIEDMVTFQLKLTKIIKKPPRIVNMTSLNSLQEWYDDSNPSTSNAKINWIAKVNNLFNEAGVKLNGDEDFALMEGDYFTELLPLLDETSSRTIVNYIHWNFISKLAKTTTKYMRDLYNDWMSYDKETSKIHRAIRCLEEGDVKNVLMYEYAKRHFSDEIPKSIAYMIDDIQKEIEYQVKESDWMDEETKDYIFAKLVNMDKLIGYPKWYKNATMVNEFFGGITVGETYFENSLNYYKYATQRELRELTAKGEVIKLWEVDPLVVNGVFDPGTNAMVIPVADLQNPIFTFERPNNINYGLIGFIMAHEVNHGFDDTGIVYDKSGEEVEWLSAMSEAYSKRAECFVNQFDKYSVLRTSNTTLKNYGNQTISENIADTMGLQAVYRAYQRREKECGKPSASLPGFGKFTNDQIFFLSFANFWCETNDEEQILRKAKSDEHSTGRLRIIGSLSNSDDFAKAFNCPVGSKMNPKKKCNIWK